MKQFNELYKKIISEAKKISKGTVEYTTYSGLTFIKAIPYNDFTPESIVNDCNEASKIANRLDDDGNPLEFKFDREYERTEYGNVYKVIEVRAKNWKSINWITLNSDNPIDIETTKAWNKFWDTLKSLGYRIKY